MNIEAFTVGVLLILMIAQNIFWARYCLMLTNRIMSRNYAEVVQVESQIKRKPQVVKSEQEQHVDPEDERQAHELNSILGMV